MDDILDVPKIFKKHVGFWKNWTRPLNDGWWYGNDYYETLMSGFENTGLGLQVYVVMLPESGKMIENDHE